MNGSLHFEEGNSLASRISIVNSRDEGRERGVLNLVQAVENEARKRRLRRKGYAWLGFLVIVALPLLKMGITGKAGFPIWLYWAGSALIAWWEVRATSRERQAARRLAELDDIRAVGPLASVLELRKDDHADSATIGAVKQGLTRLLRRLKASDSELLTPCHRQVLLEAAKDHDLKDGDSFPLAVLAAVEQVGGIEEIEAVRALTVEQDGSEAARNRARAAQRCLETLGERAERARQAQTLLRAAASDGSHDALLRPAVSAEMNQEVLLRPALEEQR